MNTFQAARAKNCNDSLALRVLNGYEGKPRYNLLQPTCMRLPSSKPLAVTPPPSPK
jgi:hypothetical protein